MKFRFKRCMFSTNFLFKKLKWASWVKEFCVNRTIFAMDNPATESNILKESDYLSLKKRSLTKNMVVVLRIDQNAFNSLWRQHVQFTVNAKPIFGSQSKKSNSERKRQHEILPEKRKFIAGDRFYAKILENCFLPKVEAQSHFFHQKLILLFIAFRHGMSGDWFQTRKCSKVM